MSVGLLRRNGNIGMMVTAIQNPSTYATLPQAMSYEYDQLNRLKVAKGFVNLNMATNTWQNGSTYNDRYYNAFSYDANACPSGAKRRRGNILTQVRHNEAGTRVENLSYKYERNANGHLLRNRLYHVNETVSAGAFADDIDDQGVFTTSNINVNNNYGYDEEGRLVRDDAEDIAQIKWTITSKVKEVIRSNGSPKKNLKFDYDPMGQRVAKHVYTSANVWEKSTYYVRDPQGNVMAVYEKVSTDPDDPSMITYHVIERHMYGSARIGMNTAKAELSAATALPDTGNYVHLIGKKQFELSNHLGNVLSSISDKLMAKDWNNDQTVDSYKGEILLSQDYTPFGVKMDGRTFTNNYRYGFNGKETDDETGIQDYGFRMYNVLLGRFLSVDPLAYAYAWNSTYCFAENDVLRCVDLDGLEKFKMIEWTDSQGQTWIRLVLLDIDDTDGLVVVEPANGNSIRTNFKYSGVQEMYGNVYVKDGQLRKPLPVGTKGAETEEDGTPYVVLADASNPSPVAPTEPDRTPGTPMWISPSYLISPDQTILPSGFGISRRDINTIRGFNFISPGSTLTDIKSQNDFISVAARNFKMKAGNTSDLSSVKVYVFGGTGTNADEINSYIVDQLKANGVPEGNIFITKTTSETGPNMDQPRIVVSE